MAAHRSITQFKVPTLFVKDRVRVQGSGCRTRNKNGTIVQIRTDWQWEEPGGGGEKQYITMFTVRMDEKRFNGDYNFHQTIEKNLKPITELNKVFNQRDHVGGSKYTVNFHDGTKFHEDGSEFFDIRLFKNKVKMQEFVDELLGKGYVRTR